MAILLKPTTNYHNTPKATLLIIILFVSRYPISNYALDIVDILSHYPDLSDFTSLVTTAGISTALDHRTSVTILAVPNTFLRSSPSATPPSSLPDVIRYHVLLQYLTWSDLRGAHPGGSLIPTLLQTTGRAPNNIGSLNLTFNPSNGVVSFHPSNNNSFSSNVISLLKTVPYNLSIYTVDSLLATFGIDLTASETRPPPTGINITKALIDGHNFNVAVEMLTGSGVIESFQQEEGAAGITLFVPNDLAFANLSPTVQLQGLSADMKSLVLKFHVLCSYYPLGSLESIVNPVQPTLATDDNGAGSFTLNIKRVNGSVAINTGIVQAVVTQTVLDQNPVAIFGVSGVLLPKEIFGKEGDVGLRSGGGGSGSGPLIGVNPPDIGPAPQTGPSHLVRSGIGGDRGNDEMVLSLSCIGGLFLYVLAFV